MIRILFIGLLFSLIVSGCSDNEKQKDSKVKDMNAKIETDLPLLHQSIIDNNEQNLIELIQNGADVNQLDPKMGNAPLHLAAQGDNPKLIEILLKNKAFVNL